MTAPVVGVDGKVPIYEPNSPWRQLNIKFVYFGTVGDKKYIANVDDLLHDLETGEVWKVVELDPFYVPKLIPYFISVSTTTNVIDKFISVGPAPLSSTFMMYIDKNTIPYECNIDRRYYINSVDAAYCKVFTGSVLTGGENVISCVYDQAGNLITNNVELELVNMPNGQNFATKTMKSFFTNFDLVDNDQVSVVIYNANGVVVSKKTFMVENSSFIRDTDINTEYVSHISLKSPFISNANPKVLEIRKNTPISSLELIGVVYYNSGRTRELPVDNTKFSLRGLESFIATIEGQTVPVVLTYTLSSTEVVYGSDKSTDKFLVEPYKIVVRNQLPVYVLKLLCFPVWINAVSGYRLEWFMINHARDKIYSATHAVNINPNSQPFNPILYGVSQELSVSVYLDQISSQLAHYKHVQVCSVTLLSPAIDGNLDTYWITTTNPGQLDPYGRKAVARSKFINQNLYELDVSCGEDNEEDWLKRTYYRTYPVFDLDIETGPVRPNLFSISLNGGEDIYPIQEFNRVFKYNQEITPNTNVYIKFIKRISGQDKLLSVCGMIIKQIN